jgi:LmbE family N-acetylglucosaminyl deacetylase
MPVERRAKTLLFVFAHQDDEIFFLNRIARELRHGHAVHCAYLTDGAGRGTDPGVVVK